MFETKFEEVYRELRSTIPRAEKYKYNRLNKSRPRTYNCLSVPLIMGFEISENKKATKGDNKGVNSKTFP